MGRHRKALESDVAASAPRIVGGDLRGRTLEFAHAARTRPMKDRVRETLFDLIGPVPAPVASPPQPQPTMEQPIKKEAEPHKNEHWYSRVHLLEKKEVKVEEKAVEVKKIDETPKIEKAKEVELKTPQSAAQLITSPNPELLPLNELIPIEVFENV